MADPKRFILTKIIATLGPTSSQPQMVAAMIDAGVRVFRLNFSHGTQEQWAQALSAVRIAANNLKRPVAVLGDLCGPKIRIGHVGDAGVHVEPGQQIVLTQDPDACGKPDKARGVAAVLCTTFDSVVDDTQPGHRLLINDGAVRTVVTDKAQRGKWTELTCKVQLGGLITRGKGINLPDTKLQAPSLTEYDLECVQWAVAQELDYLGLSFVRSRKDVLELKAQLRELDAGIPVIAKIEKPEALDELEGIIIDSEGVMVARGDLGVEMDLAEVPIIQKRIISIAHDYGKPVIVATQMLQSMIESPVPTRAEVSDVANAMYDEADAVMLSGETAVGNYPLDAIKMIVRIAQVTEEHLASDPLRRGKPPRKLQESRYRTAALAHGVGSVVRDLGATMVVAWSQKGGSARYLSQNRLYVPVIAASSDISALRQMCLMFAVIPVQMPRPANVESFVRSIDWLLLDRGWGKANDPIVIVAGEPIGRPGVTNTIRTHRLSRLSNLV